MADRKNYKPRITLKVRAAVTAMVEEGLSRPQAALKAGMSDHGLYQALRKPLVLELLRTLQEVKRTSAGARTIARAESLADGAQSEHVRLQANEWLGGIAGIVPVQKAVVDHVHTHLMPGLTIVMGGSRENLIDAEPGLLIEAKPHINMIGTPAPHPSQVTNCGKQRGNGDAG